MADNWCIYSQSLEIANQRRQGHAQQARTEQNHLKITGIFPNFKTSLFHLVQFISVAQSCLTHWDCMDCSTPGFLIHHQLPELAQIHVHWVNDAIQPSHLLSSASSPAFNFAQHQGLYQWVSSLHQLTKVLEVQVQLQSFQWIFVISNIQWIFKGLISFRIDCCVRLFCDPMDCNTAGFPVHHQLPELAQTHVCQVSDAIQLSHSLSSPSPPNFNPSQHQGLFQWVRWPKHWSFSFNISPSNEHSGLISFRMDWLDLLVVHRTLRSLRQHHSSEASILQHSAFFIVQLSHPYMITGKTVALTRWTFVGKVMSLLLNMLPRLVIAFLPRSKRLIISWLQSPPAVILDPKKESLSLFPLFPHLLPWSDGTWCRDLSFLNVKF